MLQCHAFFICLCSKSKPELDSLQGLEPSGCSGNMFGMNDSVYSSWAADFWLAKKLSSSFKGQAMLSGWKGTRGNADL